MRMFYRVDYTLFNTEGVMVDTSEGGTPLGFISGDGTQMPGLEAAVEGRSQGDVFRVSIPPEQAYGHPQRSLIKTVARETINANIDDVEVGMIFQVGSGVNAEVVRVVAVEADGITIDGNHPLAGATFDFELCMTEVRPATAEELELLAAHEADVKDAAS